jgi:hypothetical protein
MFVYGAAPVAENAPKSKRLVPEAEPDLALWRLELKMIFSCVCNHLL